MKICLFAVASAFLLPFAASAETIAPDTVRFDGGYYLTVPYRPKLFRKPYPAYTDKLSQQTLSVNGLTRLAAREEVPTDVWGGRKDVRIDRRLSGADGFWGVGKVGDRFYFVTPDGNPAIVAGVNHTRPVGAMDFCSTEQAAEFAAKFPSVEKWAAVAGRLLAENAFNGFNVAPFFATDFRRYVSVRAEKNLERPVRGRKLGHCEQLYLLRTYVKRYAEYHGGRSFQDGKNRFLSLFDSEFILSASQTMETVAEMHGGNPHLIGYYIDNELPFNSWRNLDASKGIELENFLMAEDEFYGQFEGARAYARRFMRERGKEPLPQNITVEDRDVFRDSVAHYYFRTTTEIIRRYDPDHLILGCRLFDSSMYDERTVRACAAYCDVVTVNYYNHWQPQPSYIADLAEWCGEVPFMVSEFYVKGEDVSYRGEPYDQQDGGGWIVADQQARGLYYQNFCIRLLATGRCVGWQHFDYVDLYGHDADGNLARGGSNKGIVDATYEPYREFLKLVSQLNAARYKVIDYFDDKNSSYR